jgi:hypothetical protein
VIVVSIRLFNTDRFLEFSPRWGEAAGFADWAPWAAGGVVPAGLILWLYRYELKLVGGLAARALLALRLVVLALLLFLVFWQPRVGAQTKEKATDRVLVLVDRTASMDVTDPHRTNLEKLKIARALKLCPDLVSDSQLDQWVRESVGNKEPKWVADNEAASSPDTRKHLEEDRRRAFQKVCERVDSLTRSQLVKRLLEKDGGQLLQDLGGRFDVQVIGFARDVSEFTPDQLTDLFAEAPVANAPGSPTEKPFTDLKPALERALAKAAQGNGAVRGVILISDGRQNRGDVPTDEAERLGRNRVPIFPVVVGLRDARPGVTVARVEAPTTLLKDPEDAQNLNAVIKAHIRVRATDAQALVVELFDGKKLVGKKTLRHAGGDQDYEVVFPTALSEEGTHRLTVKVQPPANLKNVAAAEGVAETQVVNDQAEVLVIDGEARWEYHYLTVALDRDKLVREVRGVVFDQPRIGRVKEDDLPRMKLPGLELPKDESALTNYDCIVLGDVPPDKLPMKERQRLQSYVRDAGGTLVIVAGKRWMPLQYPADNEKDPASTDLIAAMLPVTAPRVVQSRQGFPVTLTDDGRVNPMLALSDRGEEEEDRPARDIWAELPPHYWAVVGKKKPAATTLAYYPGEPDERGPNTAVKRSEQEARSLIAWQSYGRGRVLFVGIDSTWRWRFKVGDRHHHRFWGQLVRWATSDKLLPGGSGRVRFGTPRPRYEVGDKEDIDVRMRLDKSLPEPGPNASVAARVLRVEGEKTTKAALVTLTPRKGQPRTLEGKLRDVPPGSYKIELDFGDLAGKLGPDFEAKAVNDHAAEFVVTSPPNDEMSDVTANPDLLQILADKSAAKDSRAAVYTLDTARDILDKLKRADEQREQPPPSQALWEWWPTLLLILGLLTVEWVGRKWAGLP